MTNTFKVGDKEYSADPPGITITATDNATPEIKNLRKELDGYVSVAPQKPDNVYQLRAGCIIRMGEKNAEGRRYKAGDAWEDRPEFKVVAVQTYGNKTKVWLREYFGKSAWLLIAAAWLVTGPKRWNKPHFYDVLYKGKEDKT